MVDETPESMTSASPSSRHRGCLSGCLNGCLARGLGVLIAILVIGLGVEFFTWPKVAELAKLNPKTTAFIDRYLDSGDAAASDLRWHWVDYNQISNELKMAVVVAEDINFFTHQGFDFEEMKKVLEEAKEEGKKLRGASTLTQQLAKNLWLSPSRNPLRKVREAILTAQLEQHLKKHRILEIYLNVVEFGPGIFGAEAAAQAYFGRSAKHLSADQGAQLAASLSRPKSWNPDVDSRGYRKRVEIIRQRAEQAQWIRSFL